MCAVCGRWKIEYKLGLCQCVGRFCVCLCVREGRDE